LAEMSKVKKVFLFPDSDSVEFWRKKSASFGNCKVIDLNFLNLENKVGADLADYLLEFGSETAKKTIDKVNNCLLSL